MKTILVTGGAGFLGSHLCERLIGDGHQVLCADNFFTGRRTNLDELIKHPRFEVIRHDVTFPLFVEVDEIYNLACPASPLKYQRDPVATTKTSVLGAINLLGLAKRLKVKILQASTSEVYGDPLVHPQDERYCGNVNPLGPRGCYDEGKRCAETLFADYERQHGVAIRIARIFNTYGPRMLADDGRVISTFIGQALRSDDLTIHGDGEQTRSFCYVADTVDGLIQLMASDVTTPVNIGNPDERRLRDVATAIRKLTGSKSQLTFLPREIDDPQRRQPDITKATNLLGWYPTVAFEDGIRYTIDSFRRSGFTKLVTIR